MNLLNRIPNPFRVKTQLYIVEASFGSKWLVRADSEASAIKLVDPQGYTSKYQSVEAIELQTQGLQCVIRKW